MCEFHSSQGCPDTSGDNYPIVRPKRPDSVFTFNFKKSMEKHYAELTSIVAADFALWANV